jgi:lipid A 3-O-deacylase
MKTAAGLATLLVAAACPRFASADCEARKHPSLPKGSAQLHEENDVLLLESTDQGYTQGLRYGYTWQPDCEWRWLDRFADFMETKLRVPAILFGHPNDLTRWTSFGGGQHIFTPRDLARRDLIADDRPYAGWLYAMAHYDYVTREKPLRNRPSSLPWSVQAQTSLEYQLGIVGRESLAETAQKFLHSEHVTGSQWPHGWRHQLGTEPGLQVRYQWQGRLAHEDGWLDVVPDYSLAAGNVQITAGVGLTLRAGVSISGFPTRTLGPSVLKRAMHAPPPEDVPRESYRCGFAWLAECYLFLNAEKRYVARNLFLDGSTFRDSHRVDKEHFVDTWSTGFRLRFVTNNITLNYVYTWRSREFSPVPADARRRDGSHEYGALTVAWDTRF